MKKNILVILIFSQGFFSGAFAQDNQWAWMQGDIFPQIPVYGVKGVAMPANKPGARREPALWKDISGSTWMFGGSSKGFWDTEQNGLNDLWRYMPSTGQWTWMSGDSTPNKAGIYGTKGLAAAVNTPGARIGEVSWTDTSGNFWLFGGRDKSSGTSKILNDLWKYNPLTGHWTWVNGDSTGNQTGIYGVKGTAASTNMPGSREYATAATDASGNLCMFGGYGSANSTSGYLNDLWKYNTSTGHWTWISGDSSTGQIAIFGSKGIAAPGNKPGGKLSATSCIDASGNFWLFSGYSYTNTTNDLWRYTPSNGQWTWMRGDSIGNNDLVSVYGTRGSPAPANTPGGRMGALSWADSSGNLWFFGGYGIAVGGFRGSSGWFNDLWKYTPSTSQWTWMSGDNYANNLGVHGTKGLAAPENKPGSRTYAAGYADASGNLWLFGGEGYSIANDGTLNDLWKYTLSTGEWTWITGDDNHTFIGGTYGTKGTASAANKPGGRSSAASWRDTSGDLWLFGGSGKSINKQGGLNDLWKYAVSTGQWTWINGDSITNSKSVYGTKGIAAAGNKPGARSTAVSWTDASGNLWLFSGNGSSELWRYSPSSGQWTWMSGDSTVDARIVYGTKGISGLANTPGARSSSVGWADASGNLWLFGGSGYTSNGIQVHNDLWKYTPSTGQWTWMSGDSTTGVQGVYGTKGTAASTNKPGARTYAAGWKDNNDNLWLFGGLGTVVTIAEIFNDLWKYSPSTGQWTWVSGDSAIRQTGVYGTKAVTASTSKPGARFDAVSWTDTLGTLWLFGGSSMESYGNLNDFWKFTPATGHWTWMSGDSTINALGNYGIQGVYGVPNKPAARNGAVSWTDKSGTLWLFGGTGYISYRKSDALNDLWKYSIASPSLPVRFGSFTATRQMQTVLLNWTIYEEQNSRYHIIERSAAGVVFDSIGSVNARNVRSASDYTFTDVAPLPGMNYYRVKHADQDGRIMYSGMATVVMGEDAPYITIKQNPVQNTLQLNINLPAEQKLLMQVRDISGHLLLSKESTGSAGNSVYYLQVGHLATGTYLLSVHSGAGNTIKTFIRQ